MTRGAGFGVRLRRRAVDESDFRQVMSNFPTGVAVVTTTGPDRAPRGLTCTSFCSVSTAPPTVLVCLNRASRSLDAVRARGAFVVNLLDDGAQEVAATFARPGVDRFATVRWELTSGLRLPCLAAAYAYLECAVDRCVDAADHTVVFGRITRLRSNGRGPLLHWRRRFLSSPG